LWRRFRKVHAALGISCAVEAELDLKRTAHFLKANKKELIQLKSIIHSEKMLQLAIASAQMRSVISMQITRHCRIIMSAREETAKVLCLLVLYRQAVCPEHVLCSSCKNSDVAKGLQVLATMKLSYAYDHVSDPIQKRRSCRSARRRLRRLLAELRSYRC
jgi:hypothetical protein